MCSQRTVGWSTGQGFTLFSLFHWFLKKHSSCPLSSVSTNSISFVPQALLLLRGSPDIIWRKSSLRAISFQECQLKICFVSKMVLYFTAVLMPFHLALYKAVMLKIRVSFSVVSCLQKAALFSLHPILCILGNPSLCPLTPQPVT